MVKVEARLRFKQGVGAKYKQGRLSPLVPHFNYWEYDKIRYWNI